MLINKKKWRKQGYKSGFYLGFIFALIGFLVILLFFTFYFVFELNQSYFINFYNKQLKLDFGKIAEGWHDDKLIESLSYICSFEKYNVSKVTCIASYICNHYNFEEHGIMNIIKTSPEKILMDGGVCRDYAIIYQSLLNKLGFENEIIFIPTHAYNKIIIDNKNYTLDTCTLQDDNSKFKINLTQ